MCAVLRPQHLECQGQGPLYGEPACTSEYLFVILVRIMNHHNISIYGIN